jgi:hypothetical protein
MLHRGSISQLMATTAGDTPRPMATPGTHGSERAEGGNTSPLLDLSFRDIALLLAERGVQVTYESIRQWCVKFGPIFAASLRHRRPPARPKWHLDEVFIRSGQQTS